MEQQLAHCLQGTLSPDTNVRSQAEAALLQLHSDRSCGLALVHLILSPSGVDTTTRQSAAVSLRKWLRERWSALFDGFVGFPPQGEPMRAEDKGPIRSALLQMLALPGRDNRKLRVAGAACLSSVCSSDWPDDFPELLPSVQGMLQSSASQEVSDADRDRVHGALAFLSEFWTSEMDERQILGGARDMLPTIEALLANEQAYSPSLRTRCVLIFRQLLSSLFMVRDVYKDASKQIANELLPKWIEALVGLVRNRNLVQQLGDANISQEDKHGWIALMNEIWRTLKIASHFRSQIKQYVPGLLRLAINLLQGLQEPFAAFYLSSDAEPPFTVPDGDADISTTLPSLLCSIIDFVVEATRADRGRSVLITSSGASPDFHNLVSSLTSFARVTAEEEEEWSSDPNAFVAAIDEDAMEYGLRVACTDLIIDLLEAYQKTALNALAENVRRVCSESSRQSGGADWKVIEAALAVLGAVGEQVEDIKTSDADVAFLQDVFQHAVLPSVQGNNSPPLLTGRAYIFASQYASSLPEDFARQFVEASTQALEADSLGSQEETLIVKLSAVRCIKNFYRRLPAALLASFTPRIIAQLGPLLSQAAGDTLLLILETIQGIVSDDARGDAETGGSGIAPETYAEIVRAVFSVWSNDVKDFILLSVITDLLESLASKRDAAVAHVVVATALPALTDAFRSAAEMTASESKAGGGDDDDDDSDGGQGQGLLEAAMSIAESILKGARSETLVGCQAVQQLCGPIISALQTTQDRDVLQSGIGCLTSLVRKATNDVASWRDATTSTPSVTHFLQIISRLLSMPSESGGLKVGDFIIALLRKLPQSIVPVLGELLTGMVQRLASAQTAAFTQSLVLPFAYLLKEGQTDTVVQLLNASAGGMQTLAEKWTENVESFQGFWAQRVSTVGLTRLLSTGAPFLDEIIVRGDLIPDASGKIKTRSRSKAQPEEFTRVTLGQKILKILVREYESASDGPREVGRRGGDDGDDDDDGDDEDDDGWGSDSDDDNAKPKTMLSEFLDADLNDLHDLAHGGGFGFDDEDDEGDEDLKEDDAWGMNMKAYLREYMQGLSQSAQAGKLAGGLSADEQRRLGAILGGGA